MRKFNTRKFNFLLAAIVTILVLCSASPQQSTAIPAANNDLNSRIGRLEDYKANIDILAKIQAENLKKYVDDEIKKQMIDVEESKTTLKLLVNFGIPGTVISLIVVFVTSIIFCRKQINKKIEDIVEQKRDSIIRLIETEASDQKLLNNKQLLVISGSEETEDKMKKLLTKLKFKKVKYRRIDDLAALPEYDLMIFNTPDGGVPQETIDELMNRSEDEDDCYVAYTNAQLRRDPKLNFSNSSFTLYHNILSTLKYAQLIKFIAEEAA